MSATFAQWVDRKQWVHHMAQFLRLQRLLTWLLRLRPLKRTFASGASVEVNDLGSYFLSDAIFRGNLYGPALAQAGEVRTVVDLGCHVGLFCCYLRHFFGRTNFQGFGIDANLALLEQADRNLDRNALDGIDLFYGLVGTLREAYTGDFHVAPSYRYSSQFPPDEKAASTLWTKIETPILVPGEVWRDKYGDTPIDLLKISIAGSEGRLLKTDPALFWLARCVILEWNRDLVRGEEIFPALLDLGFARRHLLRHSPDTEIWFFSRPA